jgi:hypothetical protein
MALNLGLSVEDTAAVKEAVAASEEYGQIKSELRAAVLLSIQELSSETSPSAFEKYNSKLPEDDATPTCLSMIVDYLSAKGFSSTLSVLNEKVPISILQIGGKTIDERFPGATTDVPLLVDVVRKSKKMKPLPK